MGDSTENVGDPTKNSGVAKLVVTPPKKTVTPGWPSIHQPAGRPSPRNCNNHKHLHYTMPLIPSCFTQDTSIDVSHSPTEDVVPNASLQMEAHPHFQ
jgi:hypothetical protein